MTRKVFCPTHLLTWDLPFLTREEDTMKGHVALVREQGVNFAVVAVKASVLRGAKSQKDNTVAGFSREFGVPAVLMAQDARGVPTYYGRPDLVRWLSGIFPEQLPWREYTAAA